MHNKYLITLSLIFTLFFTVPTGAQEQKKSLQLIKVRPQLGQIFYQVFSCQGITTQTWQQLTPVLSQSILPQHALEKINLAALGIEVACIRVFQDTNGDQQLNFDRSDIPNEPVGFSNNPSLMLGYPKPSKTAVTLVGDKSIVIKMNYRRKN